jgi:exodeoxyribonuclease III
MRIVCWNVNGVRAIAGKGFAEWFHAQDADVVCLQEVKAQEHQVPPEVVDIPGYTRIWNAAKKPGYSGTAVWTRIQPDEVEIGIGDDEVDAEGRVIILRFKKLVLMTAYFPNSQEGGARLPFKKKFCDLFLARSLKEREKGHSVVMNGDFNIAHTEIDLARPKENEESPGYFPQERAWMTDLLASGMRDVMRERNPGKKALYTWWSYRGGARERNVGWRIDYHVVSGDLVEKVRDVGHQVQVKGSDHCPIYLDLANE